MITPAQDRAAKRLILESAGFLLTPEFEEVTLADPREKIVIGGWRGGKSTSLAADFIKELPILRIMNESSGRTSLGWLVGPDYVQTEEEFRYLNQWATKFDMHARKPSIPEEGSKSLYLKGNIEITTKSAKFPERLGSVAPWRIGVCEAGQTSEATREMMLGRAAQMDAHITYAGTLEDDEGQPRWAWYQELAQKWMKGGKCDKDGQYPHDCTKDHNAFSLPSWANKVWFPAGRQDPKILRLEQEYDDNTFKRRIAAIPTGVQFAVYPQLGPKQEHLLSGLQETSKPIGGAGGIDFGTVHPTALVVVQLFPDERDADPNYVGPRGIAWVREVWFNKDDPGDTSRLQRQRKLLADRYKIWQWGTDPNERYMARSSFATAVSGSQGAREHRIGLVTARLNLNKLKFDLGGPGVLDLFNEMKLVHRRKTSDGELRLLRIDDDRTAALEDAIEILDGKEVVRAPRPVKMVPRQARSYGRRNEYQSIG